MDTSNFSHRVLHKLAEELELPKLTFQVIRRTIATLAQRKGTVKDVQGMMRHSRTATTTDVYMQELPEGVRATINSIHQELMGTGTDGRESATYDSGSSSPAIEHPADRAEVTMAATTREGKESSEQGENIISKPSGTKVLQFAAKGEERRSSKCLNRIGGPGRDRTDDLFHAMEARSQLRHRPTSEGFLYIVIDRMGFVKRQAPLKRIGNFAEA